MVRLVHPFPSLLVALVTVGIVPLADADAPLSRYLVLGAGMLYFQFAIGAANDVVDAREDAAAKPWKPIPAGAVSRRLAIGVAAGFAAVGLAVTGGLPAGAWYVGLAGLACGLLYDVRFKRTALSWLPLAVALPLVPAWVYLASDAWSQLLWWAFPLGALLGLAVHLANQAPDVDANPGEPGLAAAIGARASARLALLVFGLAASGAVAVLLFESAERAWAVAALAAATLLLARRAVRFFGRNGLFGLLATASGVLGLLFVSAA
ncbi:MAG: UbiA family prenyltransferase [Dehalococcoidia bacterium]|nr:UbiA family prenyltransferase [Dehalococcoidia bacterium]